MSEKDLIQKYNTGDSFTAKIGAVPVTGKIYIDGGTLYLCQDSKCGDSCKDPQGYKYSWSYDREVIDLVITPAVKEPVVINNYSIF